MTRKGNGPTPQFQAGRMPQDLQDAVKARAEARGETVTDAVIRWARRYTASSPARRRE